jgi:hypothetical protein
MQIRRTAAALTSAAALSVTGVAMATPASAAPIFTGGLVNVAIDDIAILNDSLNNVRILNGNQVTVGVVAQVQALVCDTNVNLLAQLADDGTAECTADGQTINFDVLQA